MVKLAEIDAKSSVFVPEPSCQGGFGKQVCFYFIFIIYGFRYDNFPACVLEMLLLLSFGHFLLF